MTDAVSLFTTDLLGKVDRLSSALEQRIAGSSRGRVLIVPALPGSQLGHRAAGHDDTVWFELDSIRQGRLLELAYGVPQEPLGAFEPVYLQLVLRLRLAGYDVATHAFDWRRPARDLGQELADRIRDEGREVHLITHSFGGLVARAAALSGASNLGKVIMLGAPHQGSFEVVQGIRGNHWVLHLLATLDGHHSSAELATRCFATWPSVYDCLPARLSPADFATFDPQAWPTDGLRPDEGLLAAAAELQPWLAGAAGQLHVIAGYGIPTTERLELRDGILHYHRTDDGDGFVTTGRARLEGYPAYFARCAHIGMPNHEDVIAAVEDILDHGSTARLVTQPPPGSACASFSDDDLPEPPIVWRPGPELGAADLRALWDELAGFMAPMPVT